MEMGGEEARSERTNVFEVEGVLLHYMRAPRIYHVDQQ